MVSQQIKSYTFEMAASKVNFGSAKTAQQEKNEVPASDIVMELPVMDSVMRGIWRSVSRKSTTVYVEDSKKDVIAAKECEQENIQEQAKEDEEDIKQAIAEMKQIIKAQHRSKASKYCKIIRESVEFATDDFSDDEQEQNESKEEPQDYDTMKGEVL